MRRAGLVALFAAICVSACGGSSPTTPSTPANATTRIIGVSGDLAFGSVNLGSTAERTFTISNGGNTLLTFTGILGAGGTSTAGYTVTPMSGTVAAGATQAVTVRFCPARAQSYATALTVIGDQTGGEAVINVSGTGTGTNDTPLFTKSGTGNMAFDMPTSVDRIHITADYSGLLSTFSVYIGGSLIVSEQLGTSDLAYAGAHFEKTYPAAGGVVQIKSSDGASWSFSEVR